jgi:hypothetical protein
MIAFVIAMAILSMSFGLLALASPPALMKLVSRLNSGAGLWFAAGVRVLFGVALWTSAPVSRTPAAFQAIGAITVFAGVALPFLGQARFKTLVDWFSAQPAAIIRAWSLLAFAFGAYLLWAALA